MKKLFLKLKLIFVAWLFKEHMSAMNKDIAKQLVKRDERLCELENYMRLIKATTNIGIDLHDPNYGRSWVAVCIRGEKQQWVQFFDGDDQTIKQLQKMFSGIQKERVIIDGRPGLRAKDFWF